ncbi:MAG TPA: FAD-binding protein [Xanthobacteraceae bacterium]|nr:FAD-binding protein [Xanthobacteraceae bacterium]
MLRKSLPLRSSLCETEPMIELETDVLVVGSGGAGMYAAIEAAKHGASVILADRSLIGRGGATVMAMMTVAAAIGAQTPDSWENHFADTLAAGHGLCDESLAAILCEDGPKRILEMDSWKVGWAREDGHIKQAHAPGHDRPRCVYVDFLSTGPAVSKTLRHQLQGASGVRRVGDLMIVDIAVADRVACGATAIHLPTGEAVTLKAKSVVIATGGLTRLYRRNSASLNMSGDGYALALRAGAQLIDMEFVQFFPIGHLAPRLVGMDPIMWDPFRYKLGGVLLNGEMQEFEQRYVAEDSRNDGRYVLTRDLATYAIMKEVEAGRGSPAGGAYLSFQHVPETELRRAFGPVIDTLAQNGIDLKERPVEVAPIAHYHMGGIKVDTRFESAVLNLFACGEAVGGANGSNRLSGNAITEALVFGARAGQSAAEAARQSNRQRASEKAFAPALDLLARRRPSNGINPAEAIVELQALMMDKVGPFRTQEKLDSAIADIAQLTHAIGNDPFAAGVPFDSELVDWLDLRNMTQVAMSVTLAAHARQESRGSHQREDFPGLDPAWEFNQMIDYRDSRIALSRLPVQTARRRASVPA